ncbi:creatinase/Prolidase N-terminal domain protein, partial [Vibrio parahaemolyticus V-223/04]
KPLVNQAKVSVKRSLNW